MQRYIIIILAVAAMLLPSSHITAQTIPPSGEWNQIDFVTQSQTVYLTGDVRVNGYIKIGDGNTTGVNVTIINNTGRPVTISNNVSNGNLGAIFLLRRGCTLTVRGQEGSEVILDGGANFTWNDTGDEYTLTEQNGKRFEWSMIETNGDLTLEHVVIRDYYTTSTEQAAIKIAAQWETCGKTVLKDCTIERCKAPFGEAIYCHGYQSYDDNTPESCAITLENTVIQHCVCTMSRTANNEIAEYWGGAIRFRGGCRSNLTMRNCTMQENYSQGDGSCIWWNAGGDRNTIPVLTLDGCSFLKNKAARDAGALRIEGSFTLEGNKTVLRGNSCGRHGGAIQIAGYNGGAGAFGSKECNYELPALLEIDGNTAGGNGGGISVYFTSNDLDDGTVFNTIIDGAIVQNNIAGKNGGGISFEEQTAPGKNYVFNTHLSSGTIQNNTANENGGGIYAENFDIDGNDDLVNPLRIQNNESNGNGGGICMKNGTMELSAVSIYQNVASGTTSDGGGIYIDNSDFSIYSGGIMENESSYRGGGIFATNGDTPNEISLQRGTISANKTGLAGGGIYAKGYWEVRINGIDIENNEASNGGGMMIKGNDSDKRILMVYSSGLIRNNWAKRNKAALRTAYQTPVEELNGIGGGILVGAYASLKFGMQTNTLGLYGNMADNGADDIFASSEVSTVSVPDVSKMSLSDFTDSREHNLFWVEDYVTDDLNYDKGTYIKGNTWNSDQTNQRYRDVRDGTVEGHIYQVPAGEYSKYISLTLGWSSNYITLEKKGMTSRENAIFKIYRSGDPSVYMTVILTDRDAGSDGTRRKTIKLDDGQWTIAETSWSWAYTSDVQSITRTLTSTSTISDRIFTFTNQAEEDTPKHSESVKVNEIIPK